MQPPQQSSPPAPSSPASATPAPPAPAGSERRWFPTLAALGVILVIVFGGYVTVGALSIRTAEPVRIAGVVRLFPLSGWQVAGRFTAPPGARLTRGNADLDLWVLRGFGGSAAELANVYGDQALRSEAERLSTSEPVVQAPLGPGLEAVRFS